MTKRLLLAVLICFEIATAMAQDPHFSQFYANPIYLNPAFAGSVRCPRLALNYRNQWPGLNKTYITISASYDQHVDALGGGVGLMIMNDKAGNGTLNSTAISGIYAYSLNISRNFTIRAGLQATYMQERLDFDKLSFGDQIDQRYGFIFTTQELRPNEKHGFADFSGGMVAYSSKVYGGFAVHHLTEPDQAFIVEGSSPLPRKITAHVGALLPLKGSSTYKGRMEGTFLSPNILYQQQQGFNQLNLGMYIIKSPIIGGLWYRGYLNGKSFLSSDSFIALIGIQKELFKFGYSYDVTVSRLSNNVSGGSHEVSFGMQFECRPKKKRFKAISCPTF
jgi:type IX secretion system PorP/SprF family membrane protein